MIPNLKGSKTEANLREALAKECEAVVEYNYYASQAVKDGYHEISDVFNETAYNEDEHAHMWIKWLAPTDDDSLPHTLVNLEASTAEEQYEGTQMYPGFAKTAKEEGFDDIAREFAGVALIEQSHNTRFNKLIDSIKNNSVYERSEPVLWQCGRCGHLQRTKAAPKKCPVCGNPQSWFRVIPETFLADAPNVPDSGTVSVSDVEK